MPLPKATLATEGAAASAETLTELVADSWKQPVEGADAAKRRVTDLLVAAPAHVVEPAKSVCENHLGALKGESKATSKGDSARLYRRSSASEPLKSCARPVEAGRPFEPTLSTPKPSNGSASACVAVDTSMPST